MPAITNQPATATSIARRAGAVIATPPAASSAASSTKKKTKARGKTSTTPSIATAGEDKPDEDINAHLQAAQSNVTDSPVRKISKNTDSSTPGILKNPLPASTSTKRKNDGVPAQTSTEEVKERAQRALAAQVNRLYKRKIIQFSIELSTDSAHDDFKHAVAILLKILQEIDPTTMVDPLASDDKINKPIFKSSELPPNIGKLILAYVHLGANPSFMFQPRANKDSVNAGDKLPPMAYGTMVISCSIDPQTLVNCAGLEWQAAGGSRLTLKDLQCVSSSVIANMLNLNSSVSQSILQEEVDEVLKAGFDAIIAAGEFPPQFSGRSCPTITLRKGTPRSFGPRNKQTARLTYAQQQNKKMYQIETEDKSVDLALLVTDKCTQEGLWKMKFGKWVHVSAPLTAKDSSLAKQRFGRHCQLHERFVQGTTVVGIPDINVLDGSTALFQEDGTTIKGIISLRHVLLHLIKTPDGKRVFASVHQGVDMNEIEAVIPDMEAFHRVVEMMGKHVPGYIYWYLTDIVKMDEDVVNRLLDKTMNPAKIADAQFCQWDRETYTITTPSEEEENHVEEELAAQPWMDMAILQEGNARSRGMRGFNLDEANSLGTVHPRNDARRANAVMFQDDESSSTDVVVIDPVAPHAAADPTGFQPNNNNATPRSSTNSVDMSHDESADGMEDAAMAE